MTKKEEIITIDYHNENKALLGRLTKRNEQYIYDLEKVLQQSSIKDDTLVQLKYEMMLQMIEAQPKGVTAKQLFGTVTERAKFILEGPKEDLSKPSEDWKLYLDGALLMGSVFMLLSGISNSQQLGIVTLILNYFIVGFAMLVMAKAAHEYKTTVVTEKAKWKPTVKYMVKSAGSMIIWFLGLTLLMLIPVSINPVLSQPIYLGVGVVTFGLKLYFKKKLKIRGGIF